VPLKRGAAVVLLAPPSSQQPPPLSPPRGRIVAEPAEDVGVCVRALHHGLELAIERLFLPLEVFVVGSLVLAQGYESIRQVLGAHAIAIDVRVLVRHELANAFGAAIHRQSSANEGVVDLLRDVISHPCVFKGQVELILPQGLVFPSASLVMLGPPVVVRDFFFLAVAETAPVGVHGDVFHHLLHVLEAVLATRFLAIRDEHGHIDACKQTDRQTDRQTEGEREVSEGCQEEGVLTGD
jgi:hypothetical protein